MENNESRDYHYDNLIYVIPPAIDEDGNNISLMEVEGAFANVAYTLVCLNDDVDNVDLFMCDLASQGIVLPDDVDKYELIIQTLAQDIEGKTLLVFASSEETLDKDVIFATESNIITDLDTVLVNVADPERVWNDYKDNLKAVIGTSSGLYFFKMLIQTGIGGPLLGTKDIVPPDTIGMMDLLY